MKKPKPVVGNFPQGNGGRTVDQVTFSDDTKGMHLYAMRVWDGQSVSLPTAERVRRVEAALIDQGMDPAGLQLPVSTL